MTGPPHHPDTDDGTGKRPERDSPPRTPRWVWMSAIAVGILIVLAVVIMLLSGGQHGPARHTSSGDTSVSSSTGPAGVDRVATLASANA